MEPSLLEQLSAYNQSDYYPFHMPGHKRNPEIDYIPAGIDITEIEGFDNLHHAEGILKQAQERAARLYGAEESFFLVNGSTVGILASVSAAVSYGGTILLARNCHKSAYHGAFLRGLKVEYIYPEILKPYGICGGINPAKIQESLENNPDIKAVFITSPTYEGMVSNIREIADITHRNGCVLIVDEAHGAHLGIGGEAFPASAIEGQADIVIQSLHKTLPSMTQTAILHVQGSKIDRSKLRKYLQIYQTSSPSYVFMAGIDSCIRLIKEKGKELFTLYKERLDWFYKSVENLTFLKVLKPEEMNCTQSICEQKRVSNFQTMDPSKICIFTSKAGMTGIQLYDILLEKYHLQMEMTAGNYVLGMTSIMDTEEGFVRLSKALHEIDKEVGCRIDDISNQIAKKEISNGTILEIEMPEMVPAQVAMTAAEVEELEGEELWLSESCGRISKEYRYVYPPGVPVLVPGEVITDEVIKLLEYYEAMKLNVLGQEHEKFVIVAK